MLLFYHDLITFMHLGDAFTQRNLHCIQGTVPILSEPMTLALLLFELQECSNNRYLCTYFVCLNTETFINQLTASKMLVFYTQATLDVLTAVNTNKIRINQSYILNSTSFFPPSSPDSSQLAWLGNSCAKYTGAQC